MPVKGYKQTPEHRAKIAKKMQERRLSDEHKRKIALAHTGKKRDPFSPEWKTRLSEACRKRKERDGSMLSPKAKELLRNRMRGNTYGKANSGPNHYNWKDGTSPFVEKLYISVEYKEWRTAVFQRDGFKCLTPGCDSKEDLQAHHIYPKSLFKELVLVVENGITLCKSCHSRLRRKEMENIDRCFNLLAQRHGGVFVSPGGKVYGG